MLQPSACPPNGGVRENGLQLLDRRSGKKGKRHKGSSKLVDGKFEAVSSEKENIEGIRSDSHSREQVKFHNNHDGDNG